jgi:hypothetical protein
MTEEELIKKMADLIDKENHSNLALPTRNISYQLITLIRTSGLFMDTDMVKGLMFEKCVKCREKKRGSP